MLWETTPKNLEILTLDFLRTLMYLPFRTEMQPIFHPSHVHLHGGFIGSPNLIIASRNGHRSSTLHTSSTCDSPTSCVPSSGCICIHQKTWWPLSLLSPCPCLPSWTCLCRLDLPFLIDIHMHCINLHCIWIFPRSARSAVIDDLVTK